MKKKIFNYNFKDLKLSKTELLKVLARPEDNSFETVKQILDKYFDKFESYDDISGGYTIIESFKMNSDMKSITLNGTVLNTDFIIVKQLNNVKKVAVFACTAGSIISDLSQKCLQKDNVLEGYILDVLGSVVVEKAMDMIQKSLELDMLKHHLQITKRFSPGYCGWDVAEQSKLFTMLPDNFCNIKLTDSALMIPKKSISGIIGIGKNVASDKYFCESCPKSECLYKNRIIQ